MKNFILFLMVSVIFHTTQAQENAALNFSRASIRGDIERTDSIPDTTCALWIKKVITGDASFQLIVEQRIPAKEGWPDKPDIPKFTELKEFALPFGLTRITSSSKSSFAYTTNPGKKKSYFWSRSVYQLKLTDPNKPVRLTREDFKNIPTDYDFEDVIMNWK